MKRDFIVLVVGLALLLAAGGVWNQINPPWWVDLVVVGGIFVVVYNHLLKMLE